jgi:acyl-CoA thioester hydrolase
MRDDPRRRLAASYPWSVELQTRFADMDVNGHLNNVAISRLYEEARVRFGAALRDAHPELGRPRYVVGHVAIDYLAEGHYPAPVVIGYGVNSLGTKSYRAAMAMFQAGACIGLSDAAMVHRGEAGPVALPQALRDVLGEWLLRG